MRENLDHLRINKEKEIKGREILDYTNFNYAAKVFEKVFICNVIFSSFGNFVNDVTQSYLIDRSVRLDRQEGQFFHCLCIILSECIFFHEYATLLGLFPEHKDF